MKFFSLTLACISLGLMGCREAKQTAAAQPTSNPPATSLLTPYLPHAQPRLPTMKLYVGNEELTAELAMKPIEIFTGMMWRTNMPEGEAMLFVFPTPEPRAFYMRNTSVPLSVAYISPGGIIEEIHDLQPHNEVAVPSKSDNIQFVLEVPQGWFKRHNISAGALIRTQYGDLQKSFTFRRR